MVKRISMESITKNHSSHVERDTPVSPKRPRTDHAIANLHSGEINFEFSGLLTSCNEEGPTPLPLNTIPPDNNTQMVEFDHEYVKHKELQCENTNFNETAVIRGATPPTQDYTRPTSSAVSAIIAKGGFICQGKDEPHPKDNVGAALAEYHTLHDPGTNISALQDRGRLGKSLQRLPSAEEVGSKQHSNVEISTTVFQSSGEGSNSGKCQPDCITSNEDVIQEERFYEKSCETCVVEERNQSRDEQGVLQNSLSGEVESHTAHSDYRVSESFSFSRPPQSPSGGFAGEYGEAEENTALWGGYVKGITAVCGRETKAVCDAVNNYISAATETGDFDKGFIVAGDVVFDSHKHNHGAGINTGLRQDNLRVATEDCATGEVTAYALNQTPADHTPVERLPEKFTQRAAEGDNGTGLFNVIDPAIWREVDKAVEEKCSGSSGTTSVETSPSIALILEHAASRPTESYAEKENKTFRKSGSSEFSNGTQQHGGKNEGTCLSLVESYYFTSAAAAEEHVTSDDGVHLGHLHSFCNPAGSPAESFHALCQSEENTEAEGHLREEQNAAGPVHDSLDYPRTEGTESSLSSLMDRASRNNEGEDARSWEGMNTVEFVKSENTVQKDTAQRSDVMVMSTDEWINDWTEGKLSKCGDKSAFRLPVDDVTGNEVSLTNDRHGTETFTAVNEDRELFSSFNSILACDAMVPGPYSIIARDESVVNDNRNDTNQTSVTALSSTVLSHCVSGVYDTFEKVQLSLCDEDDLEDSPLLTSTPSQGFQATHLQLHDDDLVPDAESRDREVEEEEEEEEEGEEELSRQNGVHNTSDRSCEVPSFLSSHCPLLLLSPSSNLPSQFVPALYETAQFDLQPPTNDSALITASETLVSENQNFSEFEMKEKFDMVLEELSLYFEISPNDSTHESLSSPEHSAYKDGFQEVCGNISSTSACPSSPTVESNTDASIDTDEDCALKVYGVKPEAIFTSGSSYSEQEVPLDSSHHCSEVEETIYSSVRHKEPKETEERQKKWTLSFMSLREQEQINPGQPEKTTRLEPLQTCVRPIRVGLSKRAKTKRLHPYK